MRVKCPQCGEYAEGEPGGQARCQSCGFMAPLPVAESPHDASAPSTGASGRGAGSQWTSDATRSAQEPPPAPRGRARVATKALLPSFAVLLGVAGLGTFYIADAWFPLILSLGAIILAGATFKEAVAPIEPKLAMGLGIAGLVLGLLFLALA